MANKTQNKEQKKEVKKKSTTTKKAAVKKDSKLPKTTKKSTTTVKKPVKSKAKHSSSNSRPKKATNSSKKPVSNKKVSEKTSNKVTKTAKKATHSKSRQETKKVTAKRGVGTKAKKDVNKTTTKPRKTSTGTKTTKKASKPTKSTTATRKNVKKTEKLTKENKSTIKPENQLIEVKNKIQRVREETVIQKIKNFLTKIISMQEERVENKKSTKKEKQPKTKNKNDKPKIVEHILEYYDLPFRYNETIVKILAQTPKRLFVYWDISDSDKEKYINVFGDQFFTETYPVLLLHNEDKGYWTEIQINDFANSWYIDIGDTKSKYTVQLGRKFKSKPNNVDYSKMQESSISLDNDYLFISQSNKLETPNDHILFEKFCAVIKFRNVKTYEEYNRNFNGDEFKKIGKTYNIYDIYAELYNGEVEDGEFDMSNPDSSTMGTVKLGSSSFFK